MQSIEAHCFYLVSIDTLILQGREISSVFCSDDKAFMAFYYYICMMDSHTVGLFLYFS